jgi:hypothetical protein
MQIIVKLRMSVLGMSLCCGQLRKVATIAPLKEPYLASAVSDRHDPIQIRFIALKVVKHPEGADILHTHESVRLQEDLPIFVTRSMPEDQSASP